MFHLREYIKLQLHKGYKSHTMLQHMLIINYFGTFKKNTTVAMEFSCT